MATAKRLQIIMLIGCVLAGVSTSEIGAAETDRLERCPPSKQVSNEYLRAVEYTIWSCWFPPSSMKKHQIASVTFTLSATGRLEDIRLEKSTGNTAVDKAAISAVESAKTVHATGHNHSPGAAAKLRFRFSSLPQISTRNKLKLNLLERVPEQAKREN